MALVQGGSWTRVDPTKAIKKVCIVPGRKCLIVIFIIVIINIIISKWHLVVKQHYQGIVGGQVRHSLAGSESDLGQAGCVS